MVDPGENLDELELKKRARRRLVGAVAFASLAAVILPMVMDQTPPPTGEEIDIRIPAQAHVASNAVDATPAAIPPTAPVAAPVPPVPAPLSAPESRVQPPVAQDSANLGQPKASAPVKPKVESTPVAAKPEAVESRRVQAILDGQNSAGDSESFVVLIGAFADPANVKNLQSKLGKMGIRTFTEILESPQGRKTRVRAGPFSTRTAAEQALEKLKRAGVNGVVAPKT